MQVKSTNKVLIDRFLRYDKGEDIKDWALEMMEQGYESEHLIILAGLTPPFEANQVDEYFNKALGELGIQKPSVEEAVHGYVYFLISESLQGRLSTKEALTRLKNLYVDLGYCNALVDFYNLYWAEYDLKSGSTQYYWEGATLSNFDEIVEKVFTKWIENHELGQRPNCA